MSKRLCWVATFAVAALLTGCIEFEKQTVTYRHDAKADTLRFFQYYEGIFGASNRAELTEDEQSQIQSVLTTQRTFFFANWIFEFNRQSLQEVLKELKEGGGEVAKLGKDERRRLEVLCSLLLENVRVENGGFHLGAGGKLCGTQRVTVKNASKIIRAANEFIRDQCRAEAAKDGNTAEERAIYAKSAAQSRDYIAIEGNRLRVRVPMTRADYDKDFGSGADSPKQLGEFVQAGGTLAFADNELTATIGKVADKVTALTLSMAEKTYVPNLLEVVKRQPGVKDKFDVKVAEAAFLAESPADVKKP